MKKKNKVIDNKQKKKLIITSIFMLFLVVAASFAYYEMNSTESITSVFTSNFGETGGVSLTGPTPNLHIKLTNKDMHYTKEGTSYFATDDNNKNYDTTPVERTIARLEAVDTNPTYTYYCKFKLAIDVRDSKNNKFKSGDAILHLSGHYEADLDLSNYDTPIDIEYFLDQDNTSKEIKAVLEVKNTNKNQNYAEDMNIYLDIYNSNLACDNTKYNGQTEFEFAYTGSQQEFTVPTTGLYKIELWGAQGGNARYSTLYAGGNGGYTSGIINISKNQKLYLYVGGMGVSHSGTSSDSISYNGYGYNGGGPNGVFYGGNSNGGGGGGATDIRLVSGNWDNEVGLKSRIMVAAGGGGADSHSNTPNYSGNGGAGGGLNGYDAPKTGACYSLGIGATQISAGKSLACDSGQSTYDLSGFGYAGNIHAGGGGGYYGGGAGYHTSAAGGSSFISGHTGCLAIESESSLTPRQDSNGVQCVNGTSDIECSKHYSGYLFTDTVMIDGLGYKWTTEKGEQVKMPNPEGGYYNLGQGHTGNGYAKITYVGIDYGTDLVILLEEGFGTLSGDKKLRRKIGYKIGELPIPTNEIEAFRGWYTKDGELVDENTIVTSKHQKLYAKYGTEFAYTGDVQEFVVGKAGTYKVELWGATGGDATYSSRTYYGGKGSYVSGEIELKKDDKLYVYVGGKGTTVSTQTNPINTDNGKNYNGGGWASYYSGNSVGGGGGGATDIRLSNGIWSDTQSLASRIMVAAGGGGARTHASNPSYSGNGGAGGTLTSSNAVPANNTCYSLGTGASQIKGGSNTPCPSDGRTDGGLSIFGYGGVNINDSHYYTSNTYSGGGGGYYGGGRGYHAPASGGSSYISGYEGCIAIKSKNDITPKVTTYSNIKDSYHYSGYKFNNGKMVAGSDNTIPPSPDISGNGYARITFIR